MLFKDLLVLVGRGDAASSYGLGLARACGATLTAAMPVIEPYLPPYVLLEIPDEVLARRRQEVATEAERVLHGVSENARSMGVAAETLAFEVPEADEAEEVSNLARCFDATIVQQPDPDGRDTSAIIEATLFKSGRPIIIVPFITARPEIRTAVIAWDGGPQAARAAGDALPLLRLANRVQVVTVDDDEIESDSRRQGRERLARHLGRHGIAAEPQRLVGDVDVPDLLLSHLADAEADLLVMGGYGHARWREMVLGGTTRTILRSMTVPVLMAH
jgi:nucleotide-binding universal stress UspA family protein